MKCSPATITSDKLQNGESRILEATVRYSYNYTSLDLIDVNLLVPLPITLC